MITNSLRLVLLVAAFMCFILTAAGVPARVNLLALGLALWVLTVLLSASTP